MDLVRRAPRLPVPGETVSGNGYFQAFGGKGANQAVAAARAGADVLFVSAVGDDDFGRASLAQFRIEGIDTRFIRTLPDRPTGVALIFVDETGRNMIGVHPGANHGFTADDADRLPDELFEGGGVFVAQLETPPEAVARAMARAREAGMVTILNPAPADPTIIETGLLRHADLVVPNETEAGILTGVSVTDAESAARAAEILLDLGGRGVIITLGANGSLLFCPQDNRGSPVRVPARKVQAIDTVAAGDAYVGTLASSIAETTGVSNRTAVIEAGDLIPGLLPAVRRATLAASISVTRPGAQPSLPRREEIDGLD